MKIWFLKKLHVWVPAGAKMDPKREPKITKILSKALSFRIRFSVDFANTSFVEVYYLSGCPEPPKCGQNAVLSFKIEGTTFSLPNRLFLKMGAKMAPRMTSQTLQNVQKNLPEHLFKKTHILKSVLDTKVLKNDLQNGLSRLAPALFFASPHPPSLQMGPRPRFGFILAPFSLYLVTIFALFWLRVA